VNAGGGSSGDGSGGPERVGDVLGGLFDRLGITREIARQGTLERWDEVVGPRIASVTQPSAVSGGVLFVKVTSSAWLSELNLMRHDILRRLNAGQGEGRVERIVFTLWEKPPDDR
jgi:predicted nucleic acid-binding Zn ribbon protein